MVRALLREVMGARQKGAVGVSHNALRREKIEARERTVSFSVVASTAIKGRPHHESSGRVPGMTAEEPYRSCL